ncbi:ABC transporter substrate-binding protein [Brevibacterium album]|uniref:ABC transporter substrate-binding protein n=1 Tax=Brevibacterium album TaxID=417948 RepID=UPI000491638B|nr:ABC transporter substrate-binding protein [Brevibacterium album]
MRRRLWHTALAASLTGTVLLAGCGSGGGDGQSEQTLRFGISGEVPVLKAGQEQGNLGATANSLLHRGLMTYDSEAQLVPALAESYEQISPTEYSFVLPEGLTFHDGTELTVDSVRSSWEYFADPENGSAQAEAYANIEAVEAGEAGEFTVVLKEASSAFLQTLADVSTPILPEAALDPEAESDVGAGPFSVVDQQSGVGMTLEKFDGYAHAQEVALDGVELVYYADGASRVNALQGGDVDLIDYVPWESFDQLEQAGFTVDGKAGPGLDVQFNFEAEPLNDPLVREAIAYAIDREKVVENVFSGYAEPVFGQIVEEGGEFDTPAVTEMYDYDPERAKELLAEAGHEDGFDISLLGTSQYAFVQDTAISVQQDLEAVGIRTELELPDWPTMMDNMLTGEYELGIGTISATISDPSYLLRFVDSPAYVHPWGYENAELTQLLKDGRAAETDEARIESYQRAFELLREDTPYAVMMQRQQAYAYSEKVSGFSTLPGLIVFGSGVSVAHISLS